MAASKQTTLLELAKVQVTSKRTIVISRHVSEDKILIGQQMHVKDEYEKDINFFVKGALNIPIEQLPSVRDALNEAIEQLEHDKLL